MNVCVFRYHHSRSKRIAEALAEGARRIGWKVLETEEQHTSPRADVLLSYGWRNQPMFDAYRKAGHHYVYVDLGYWLRKRARSDYGGFHKVVVDAKHATDYFRRISRPFDRLALAPPRKPWKLNGRNIIIAGLSAKGAAGSGMPPLVWEHATIKALRRVTDRPIVYRPKPTWHDARPIPGTEFSTGDIPIEAVLEDAHAVVTLHSNAAIDGLAAGVAVHAEEGLASVMSTAIADIENPHRPDDREQFFADVSYCHWSRAEIATGMVFDMFKQEGLLD